MFDDRKDAGRALARALQKYRGRGALVLAIPRGGVEVGYEVARGLGADFSILVARKLPFPDNPEAGFGAVAEDGSVFINDRARRGLGEEAVNAIIDEQREEALRRTVALRGGRPLPDMEGRTVIVVDDGMAMGSTMRASVIMLKNRKAGRIVVAVPVSGGQAAAELAGEVDDVVVVEQPEHFRAVAQAYRRWYDVQDGEVIEIMRKWEEEGPKGLA